MIGYHFNRSADWIYVLFLASLLLLTSACALPTRADGHLEDERYGYREAGANDSIPRPVAVSGHSMDITDLVVTPDGQYLITTSKDWSIIMWDVVQQRVVRRFSGHKDAVTSVDVSQDGRYLVSGSVDETVRVWNLSTGEELQRVVLRPAAWQDIGAKIFEGGLVGQRYKGVTSVAFSPNGRHILCGSKVGLYLLEWETNLQVQTYDPKGVAKVYPCARSIAFDSEGQYALTGKDEGIGGNAELWEVATGRHVGSLEGAKGTTVAVSFTPSGPQVAMALENGELALWDLTESRMVQRFVGHSAMVQSAALSRDGRRLLTGGDDKTVRVWNVNTGREIQRFNADTGVNVVSFWSTENFVLGAAYTGVYLWNLEHGRLSRAYFGDAVFPPSVNALSPDGRFVLNGYYAGRVTLWNLHTGRRIRQFEAHKKRVTALAFSSDGKRFLSGSADKTMRLWNIETGREIGRWEGFRDSVEVVAFSPGDQYFVSGAKDRLLLWTLDSQESLRSFGGAWGKFLGGDVEAAVFSLDPDSTYVAGTYYNYESGIRVWNTVTGELKWQFGGVFEGHRGTVRSMAFSPNGNRLLSGADDKTVRLWDLKTGEEAQRLKIGSPVKRVAYDPTGQYILAVSVDNTIQLWDLDEGKRVRTLYGHWSPVRWAGFTGDGQFILSSSEDSTQRIWDVETGRQLVVYIQTVDGGWIVYTPDGLFDGSPSGWNALGWRFRESETGETAALPVEIFFKEYFYPNLLSEIFAGKRPTASKNITERDRRQPKLKIVGPIPKQPVEAREIPLTIEAADVGSGLRDLRVFRNQSLIHFEHGDLKPDPKTNTFRLPVSVKLVARKNEITAYAFNHDDIKSEDARVVIEGAESLERKGTAYILAVGLNRYKDPDYNLEYAVADAKAVAKSLCNSLEGLNAYAEVVPIHLLDEQATKTNILAALARLADDTQPLPEEAPATLKRFKTAEPEDVVIMYFAGHGTVGRGEDDQDRYFLIPHRLCYLSDRDLEEGFEGIDAINLMLIIDACQSGQALEAEEKRRGPMNSRGLAQLAYEKGMYILAAAQSDEAAKEFEELEHGLLTYTLVEKGLKRMAADTSPTDGRLTAREWLDYAVQQVPQEMARKMAGFRASKNREIDFGEKTVTGQEPQAYYRKERTGEAWTLSRQ